MKKIPDINEALVSAFAKKLLELYKNKDPNFIALLEYIFVRAFTAAVNQPDNLLSNIRYTYDINGLSALAELLKKIPTHAGSTEINQEMNSKFQSILRRLFPEPQQLISHLNTLLIFHYELSLRKKDYNDNIKYILEFLVKLFCSIKSYKECLIVHLKRLLAERKMLPAARVNQYSTLLLEHQIMTLCMCFGDFETLISEPEPAVSSLSKSKNVESRLSITIEDTHYLFMLFSRDQDAKAYLRGNGDFEVKIQNYFANQDAKRLFVTEPRLIPRKLLTCVIAKIINASPEQIQEFQLKDKRDVKDNSNKKDSQLHILITQGIQEFFDWLLKHSINQLFSTDLLHICNWVIEEMYVNKKMQMSEVRAYIAGVIFLRMINPAIINISLDKTDPNKLVEIKDPHKLAIVKNQLVSISIVIQGLANATNKDINKDRCSPGQIALIFSEKNRRNMVKFLDQFFVHLPALAMTSASIEMNAPQPVVLSSEISLASRELSAEQPAVLIPALSSASSEMIAQQAVVLTPEISLASKELNVEQPAVLTPVISSASSDRGATQPVVLSPEISSASRELSAEQPVALTSALSSASSERIVLQPFIFTPVLKEERRLSGHRRGNAPFIRSSETSPKKQLDQQPFTRSLSVSSDDRIQSFNRVPEDARLWRRSYASPQRTQQQQPRSAIPRSSTLDNIPALQAVDRERVDITIAEDRGASGSTQLSLSASTELAIAAIDSSPVVEAINNNDSNNSLYAPPLPGERSELAIAATDSSAVVIEAINNNDSNNSLYAPPLLGERSELAIVSDSSVALKEAIERALMPVRKIEEELSIIQPQLIGTPHIIINENMQLIYINCMLTVWYAACRDQLTAIKDEQTVLAPSPTATIFSDSINFGKVLFRTALPSIKHVVESFKVLIFNQDELVKLYNELMYLLNIYRNECQRLTEKMLTRVKSTITVDQDKWHGEDQSKVVVDSFSDGEPLENLSALDVLVNNDTSTLNLPVVLRGNAQQQVGVKQIEVDRKEGAAKLPASFKSWEQVIDHLKADDKSDMILIRPIREISADIVVMQNTTDQNNQTLQSHKTKIQEVMGPIKILNEEIAVLRRQIENKKKDPETAAEAALRMQVKQGVLQQCTPPNEQIIKMRDDLKYYQDAAYYSKQQLESVKFELKIALLCQLKTEIMKLAQQCQLRGLYENEASKKIVSSAKLPRSNLVP